MEVRRPFKFRWWIAWIALAIIFVSAAGWGIRHVTSAQFIEARLSDAASRASEGLYRVTVGSSRFDLFGGTYVATNIDCSPDSLVLVEWEREKKRPRLPISLKATTLRVNGINVLALTRGRAIATSATFENLQFDAFLNRQVKAVRSGEPAALPHVSIRSLDRLVRIDTLVVKAAEASYSELAADGARAGMITFNDLEATFYNVTNDPLRMTPETPCNIGMRFLLAGEGRTNLGVQYDLLSQSDKLDLRYQGTIGPMNAKAFNQVLENLEGLRVTGGRLDSTWFEFDVKDDIARGKIQVLYHNLSFELRDKGSHEQSRGDHFRTFMMSHFKIRDANTPSDKGGAMIAQVHLARTPKTGFIKFLWQNIRDGLFETLGIE